MIELYCGDPRLINLTRDAAAGRAEVEVYCPDYKELPEYADYTITAGQLNAGVERFSAGFGAMTVVLPEGGDYLAEKGAEGYVVVIGTDYRRVKF